MKTKRHILNILFFAALVFLFVSGGLTKFVSAEPSFDIKQIYGETHKAVVVVISELYEAKPSNNPQKKSEPVVPASSYHMLTSSKIRFMPYIYFVTAENGEKTRYSLGAGFVIAKSGLIVTNYHVVDEAKTIMVEFADGRAYPARIVGFDPAPGNDIAVLQILADRELTTLAFSQESEPPIGQKLFSIGHPFSTKYTASHAMVSNLYRSSDILAAIQIHSSTLPGNSGGPLMNERGEVSGIVFGALEGSETQGLAIPALKVKQIIEKIMNEGRDESKPR